MALIGNYGVGNLGDEALKEYFFSRFPEVEWLVVSATPGQGEYPRLPAGIRSFFSTPWWRTLRMLWGADGVVFGGGSLFTDTESIRACVLWGLHAFVGRMLRKPMYFAFQGIGPFRSRVGEWMAKRELRGAKFLSVRDDASAVRVESWKLNTNVIRSIDPILLLLEAKKEHECTKKILCLIPRIHQPAMFAKAVADLCGHEEFDEGFILSLQPDSTDEQRVCAHLQAIVSFPLHVRAVRSMQELVSLLRQSSHVVSARFHGALAAYALGVPLVICPQQEGDKLWALRAFIGKHPDPRSVREEILHAESALRRALEN